MAVSNATIAGLLRQYAAMLVVEGADRFKVKAYRRAAETLESLDVDLPTFVARGHDLQELPGVGKAIGGTIEEILRSGQMPQLQKSVARVDPVLVELASKPALDPKAVMRVFKKLKIHSLAELKDRLESGVIREVFGPRLDFQIRHGLDDRQRLLWRRANDLAINIETFLRSLPGVSRVAPAGSLRRKQDTVGDLNFLISGTKANPIFRRFSQFGGVKSSQPRAKDELLYHLSSGVAVSLLWTKPAEWGLSWITSTGSAAHLDELSNFAKQHKLQLSRDALLAKGIDISEETSIYEGLGLSFIEPELREGRGEIEAARRGKLPQLIRTADLKGDLHMHTIASDGANSIEEMANAARDMGYSYIAITDHSQSLRITNGLTEARLVQHLKNIDKLNARLQGITVLKSAEVDILEDGSLDYSNEMLKELDLTICSIHSKFSLDKERQTARILRAMDNPYFNILGHATGRLLLKRPGYDIDMERIIKHAKQNGCCFEINSDPNRLDLSDESARMAKDAGVKIAINTDAHSTDELSYISGGISQARRAWLTPHDVLNTLPLTRLRKALRRS